MNKLTPEIISAAIEGFQAQKRQIDEQVAALRAMLPARSGGPETAPTPVKRKRRLSAAGRKRIAEAARRRWAAVKAAKASEKPAGAKKAPSKRGARRKAAKKNAA